MVVQLKVAYWQTSIYYKNFKWIFRPTLLLWPFKSIWFLHNMILKKPSQAKPNEAFHQLIAYNSFSFICHFVPTYTNYDLLKLKAKFKVQKKNEASISRGLPQKPTIGEQEKREEKKQTNYFFKTDFLFSRCSSWRFSLAVARNKLKVKW